MMNFLATLLPALLRFTTTVTEKNPRTTAWATLGVGLFGILGYAPNQIRDVLTGIANFFVTLAQMVPG